MEIYNAHILKELIVKSELKHSYLAHGICDTAHLSNVLNGKRKLSTELFRDIVLKLGLDPSDYIHVQNLQDIEQIEKLSRLRGLLREKPDDYLERSAELIAQLEPKTHLFSIAQNQDLMNARITLLFYNKHYSAVRNIALQSLSMTRQVLAEKPRGMILLQILSKQLPRMILSHREVGLFIKLAIGYGADPSSGTTELTHLQISNTILEKLWGSIAKLPDENYEIVNVKIMCLVNYTNSLDLLKKRELVIELCDVRILLCGRYWDGEHLPLFLARKGHNLVETNQKTAGQECLRKACLLFEGAGKTKELESTKKILAEIASDCD